jgi:hypothetical protein
LKKSDKIGGGDGWVRYRGREVAQKMYTHMDKCKNNKKKLGLGFTFGLWELRSFVYV